MPSSDDSRLVARSRQPWKPSRHAGLGSSGLRRELEPSSDRLLYVRPSASPRLSASRGPS
jgi:hypothetical protein